MIPVREMAKPSRGDTTKKARGFSRGMMGCHFDKEIYNLRSLVETVNSMVKRKMGDAISTPYKVDIGHRSIVQIDSSQFQETVRTET
jgi:hypothetical protein